jgi:hypothetical protein
VWGRGAGWGRSKSSCRAAVAAPDLAVVKEISRAVEKLFAIELTLYIERDRCSGGTPQWIASQFGFGWGTDHAIMATNIDRRTLAPIEFCPITLERRQSLKLEEGSCIAFAVFTENARSIYSQFVDSLFLELALCDGYGVSN